MMLRILRDKFLRLGRDEDGVAMVVTLAIFMFMYLVCIGVYAIGTAVKTRIHLQNACDAAAYSAALVQADTLSRIATINRAMSWTYIQMSKRQMDYIVWKWLDTTVPKVQRDVALAKSSGSPGLHFHDYWTLRPMFAISPRCGSFDDEDHSSVAVSLNGTSQPRVGPQSLRGSIKYEISNFKQTWFKDSSFYKGTGSGIDVMRRQIEADKETLKEMYSAEKALARNLPGHVTSAVKDALDANMIPGMKWRHKVYHSMTPYAEVGSTDSYLEILSSSEEKRFLKFSRYSRANSSKPFDEGSGILQWFPLAGGVGFCRNYSQKSALRSSWTWRSWTWTCTDKGCYKIPSGFGSGSCLGSECYDSYFDGVSAKPLILKKEYFGKNGTITVGVAAKNKNPWSHAVGSAITGLFSAFNIGGASLPWTPQYTVCFASARAGYKEDKRLNWNNSRSVENDRAYRVDWEDGDWNLCQSDLDAVLIPVRRAESFASNRTWGGNITDISSYAQQLGVDGADDMRAGGDGLDVSAHYSGRDTGDEYRFGRTDNDPPGFWRGVDPPLNYASDKVNAKWQVENPHGRLEWENIQKVMFH